MTEYAPTERTTLRRKPARAVYDRDAIHSILDEAIVCHVSVHVDEQTLCVPMVYTRIADAMYLHGSRSSRVLVALRAGVSACINVTLLDGLVLARSAFRSSVNFRSVMIFGTATEVTDPQEKQTVFRSLVESQVPGRWQDVRDPSREELQIPLVVKVPLSEVSAKVRTGPPEDNEADYARDCWAGVIPLRQTAAAPIDAPRLHPGVGVPQYATDYARPPVSIDDTRGPAAA